jgi:sugar phosphate isomerase/epimerase
MAKLGLIFYPFPNVSLQDFLRYAARTGFGYVEIPVGRVWDEKDPAANPEKQAAEVKKMLDDLGLKVGALSSGNDFVLLDEAQVAAQCARMERVLGIAKVLQAGCIRTEGGWPKDSVPPARWAGAIVRCCERLVEPAEKAGIGLAIDNHGLVTNAEGVLEEVFRRIPNRIIGSNLDTFNWRWYGHSMQVVKELWNVCIPRVLHTHLKDGTGSREQYVGKVLGEGEGEAAEAVRRLKAAGCKGVFCAECEAAMPSEEAYAQCLKWMKANI